MTTIQFTNNVFSTSPMNRGSNGSENTAICGTHLLSNNGRYNKIVSIDNYSQQDRFPFALEKKKEDSIKISDEKIIIGIKELKIEDKMDENDSFHGNVKETLDISLNSFSSTSTLSCEEGLYDSNPRVLFKRHWLKNLPERVESFTDQPFPLRETLSRICTTNEDMNEAYKSNSLILMQQEVSQSSKLFEEKRKRFIFGLNSNRMYSHLKQKKIIHTSSDIILKKTWKSKAQVRKIPSTSLLLRKNNMERKNRNVRFNPRIAVVEYERTLQIFAKDGWEKYYV